MFLSLLLLDSRRKRRDVGDDGDNGDDGNDGGIISFKRTIF